MGRGFQESRPQFPLMLVFPRRYYVCFPASSGEKLFIKMKSTFEMKNIRDPKCMIFTLFFLQVNCKLGPSSDKKAFADFITELREAFNEHGLLLTAAVSANKKVIDEGSTRILFDYVSEGKGGRAQIEIKSHLRFSMVSTNNKI